MKWILHRLRAFASISLLPIELLKDWLHCVRWGKGSPFTSTQGSLYYDIVLLAHTVEKGLSLDKTRPTFGAEKISTLLQLCERYDWGYSQFPLEMTYGALKEYRQFHATNGIDLPVLGPRIDAFIRQAQDCGIEPRGGVYTPLPGDANLSHSDFLLSRWSCRNFASVVVPPDDVHRIIQCAQSAPSQCNRQSVRIHCYQNPEDIKALLTLQGGSAGFTEHVHNLFVVTSEAYAWSGAKPRHQAYVDGGIFSMQLGMSCIANGYGCCFLNLAVTNRIEKAIKHAGRIPQSEKLVLMMAFGVAQEAPGGAARSPRVPVEQVLTVHAVDEGASS